MGKNSVSVYAAPEMALVDKKSIKLEGVVDFCWSPADPILSVYQPERGGKTPNPKPQTPNPKPQTPIPKPQTPNPKP
jgi:hypothetical protein